MTAQKRTVYLVGAGPGDPDLITVRGYALLKEADVIVFDRLVSPELVANARAGAEVIDVGKAPGTHRFSQEWINAILVDRAQSGKSVVRLKGGDPFVFGRGLEELDACVAAGINCHVIPGVSSALAAPAAAGIAVTRRGAARSLAIITGQTAPDSSAPALDFDALARMDTVVVLMGRANLAEITAALMEAGRGKDTPAACIAHATTPKQRVIVATLATISDVADRESIAAPMVTVIGHEAARASSGQQYGELLSKLPSSGATRAG